MSAVPRVRALARLQPVLNLPSNNSTPPAQQTQTQTPTQSQSQTVIPPDATPANDSSTSLISPVYAIHTTPANETSVFHPVAAVSPPNGITSQSQQISAIHNSNSPVPHEPSSLINSVGVQSADSIETSFEALSLNPQHRTVHTLPNKIGGHSTPQKYRFKAVGLDVLEQPPNVPSVPSQRSRPRHKYRATYTGRSRYRSKSRSRSPSPHSRRFRESTQLSITNPFNSYSRQGSADARDSAKVTARSQTPQPLGLIAEGTEKKNCVDSAQDNIDPPIHTPPVLKEIQGLVSPPKISEVPTQPQPEPQPQSQPQTQIQPQIQSQSQSQTQPQPQPQPQTQSQSQTESHTQIQTQPHTQSQTQTQTQPQSRAESQSISEIHMQVGNQSAINTPSSRKNTRPIMTMMFSSRFSSRNRAAVPASQANTLPSQPTNTISNDSKNKGTQDDTQSTLDRNQNQCAAPYQRELSQLPSTRTAILPATPFSRAFSGTSATHMQPPFRARGQVLCSWGAQSPFYRPLPVESPPNPPQ